MLRHVFCQAALACVVFATLSFVSHPAIASCFGEHCETTLNDYRRQYYEDHRIDEERRRGIPIVTETMVTNAEETVFRQFPTGVGVGSPASTVKNLVPLIDISALPVSTSDTDQRSDIALALNGRFLGAEARGDTKSGNAQVMATADSTPALLPPLRAALDAEGESALRNQLEQSLALSDTLGVEISYALEFGPFGRSPEKYDWLSGALLAVASRRAQEQYGPTGSQDLRKLFANTPGCLVQENGRNPRWPKKNQVPNTRFGVLAEPCRSNIRRAIAQNVRAAVASDIANDLWYTRSRVSTVGRLVANNPQLYFTAIHTPGDTLVGARYTGGRISFEMGLASAWWFARSESGSSCRKSPGVALIPDTCLDGYMDYFDNNPRKIDRTSRLYVSLEFGRIRAIDTTVDADVDTQPADGLVGTESGVSRNISGDFEIAIPETDVYRARAGFGQVLRQVDEDDPLSRSSRFDLVARYDAFDADIIRSDFWEVSATLTYRAAGISIPFQLRYQSETEFGIDGSDSIDTIVGIAYDLGRGAGLP